MASTQSLLIRKLAGVFAIEAKDNRKAKLPVLGIDKMPVPHPVFCTEILQRAIAIPQEPRCLFQDCRRK